MSIQLKNIHKAFGDKKILKGFSLEVREGETLCVLGQSGSGKSVTLKHIVRLLTPDEGEVWVDGVDIGKLRQDDLYDLRRNVGYVFQFAALFDSMTIADNVGLGLRRLKENSDDDIRERVSECLRLVDLEGFEERMPAELSGGQKKRAGLARGIATRPKYLLYDEPTTGLDPITKTVIDRLILRMKEQMGVTGIVITHDLESAFRVSDRLAVLYDGQIRFVGTADEIRSSEDPIVKGFILGEPNLLETGT